MKQNNTASKHYMKKRIKMVVSYLNSAYLCDLRASAVDYCFRYFYRRDAEVAKIRREKSSD